MRNIENNIKKEVINVGDYFVTYAYYLSAVIPYVELCGNKYNYKYKKIRNNCGLVGSLIFKRISDDCVIELCSGIKMSTYKSSLKGNTFDDLTSTREGFLKLHERFKEYPLVVNFDSIVVRKLSDENEKLAYCKDCDEKVEKLNKFNERAKEDYNEHWEDILNEASNIGIVDDMIYNYGKTLRRIYALCIKK